MARPAAAEMSRCPDAGEKALLIHADTRVQYSLFSPIMFFRAVHRAREGL